ncbi:tryptophan 7-halogenase [Pseudoalteromonas tunicata]|uniref:tryptophan halogenase family protein n=1 Tax=Pseudoalteromonas tunicata TaxID=314281 RepID=UPI00273FD475|nr:tryptophan halogenase family protein [Pseudoalteromonas tunicata]MDP5211538.1 tryptophan 7-halogenase [Pseudoalteromonas tunicata]
MIKQHINNIVIVGGGTAGWMTAAALSHQFKQQKSITLIESADIGTIGVGEATIPTLRRFYQKLGLTDEQVLRASGATCKLGIEFKDWHTPNHSFIHPFGLYGQRANGVDFHQYWLKLKQLGDNTPLADYSFGVNLAKHNKFSLPVKQPNSPLAIFDWALHFDASLFAKLMRQVAEQQGVKRVENCIEQVTVQPTSGNIEHLILKDGQVLSGDLFIDCSGFKALLIEGALKTGYEDWSHWLLCDRAVAVQSSAMAELPSRTVVQARPAGWQWTIPLQQRTGNGHVYSSRFMNADDAHALLLNNIHGEPLHAPRHFSFTPGRRKRAWHKNCVAIGLAAGFLEPLESTSIALVETAIDKLSQTLAQDHVNEQLVMRFNDVTAQEYERVRDFIILHYKLNQRSEPLWQHCQAMAIPASLQAKIDAFCDNGSLERLPWEMFGPDSWLAIFDGFSCYPTQFDVRVNKLDVDYLRRSFKLMAQGIAQAVADAPTHNTYLSQLIAAPSQSLNMEQA